MSPSVRRLLGTALTALAIGCGSGNTPGAQSPERQADAEYDLARDYFYKGQPREALDHSLRAVDLDGDNSKALYFTSTLYLWFCSGNRGLQSPDCQMARAESYARKALDKDPAFRDARNLLGQVLILEEKYKEAISVLQPLVTDPSYNASYLAWGNLGWAQVLDGQVDAGITSLRNSVTQPKFCVGFYRLGMAFEKKGDLAQAETNFSQAVEVDSADCQNLQDAWQERGKVRLKLGKKDDACSDLTRCRDISVDTPAGKSCAALVLSAGCSKTDAVLPAPAAAP